MKIFTFVFMFAIILLSSVTVKAQIPQKFNYQAVIRNNSGAIIQNQNVGVRIIIHDATPTGTVLYQEVQTITTNNYGLITLEIGGGTVQTGIFANINWVSGARFIEVDVDATGGTNYVKMGTSQLLSVPYALYSLNTVNKFDGDSSSTNELQTLSVAGGTLTISKGNSVSLPKIYDGDSSSTNEIQALSLAGNNLTISKGNTISLPFLTSQYWTKTGTNLYYNLGNVGIGTTNPSKLLHLYGSSPTLFLESSPGTSLNSIVLKTNNSVENSLNIGKFDSTSIGTFAGISKASLSYIVPGAYSGGLLIGTTGSHPIIFGINNTEAMRLSANGYLGIGTNNPGNPVQISKPTGAFFQATATNNTGWAGLAIEKGTSNANGYVIYRTGTVSKWYVGTMVSDDYNISRTFSTGDGLFTIKQSNGYVGIGTTSPASRLEVVDTNNANITLRPVLSSGSANLFINKGSSGKGLLNWQSGGTTSFYEGLNGNTDYSLSRTATEDGTFHIKATNGYVGIGTTAPTTKLDIADSDAFLTLRGTGTNGYANMFLNRTGTGKGFISYLTSGVYYWYIGMLAGSDYSISHLSTPDGTFYINASTRYVGIGTTNPRNTFQVNGFMRMPGSYSAGTRYVSTTANYGIQLGMLNNLWTIRKIDSAANPGSYTDIIDMDPSATVIPFEPYSNNTYNLGSSGYAWKYVYGYNAYQQTSDGRVKKNIQNLDYGLNTIMKLRPVSFEWKEDSSANRKLGFIAQEVEKVVPEVVQHTFFSDEQMKRWREDGKKTGNSDVYSMGYSDLIPLLVKGMQEQQQTIESMKAQIEQLQKIVEELKVKK